MEEGGAVFVVMGRFHWQIQGFGAPGMAVIFLFGGYKEPWWGGFS